MQIECSRGEIDPDARALVRGWGCICVRWVRFRVFPSLHSFHCLIVDTFAPYLMNKVRGNLVGVVSKC